MFKFLRLGWGLRLVTKYRVSKAKVFFKKVLSNVILVIHDNLNLAVLALVFDQTMKSEISSTDSTKTAEKASTMYQSCEVTSKESNVYL